MSRKRQTSAIGANREYIWAMRVRIFLDGQRTHTSPQCGRQRKTVLLSISRAGLDQTGLYVTVPVDLDSLRRMC
jgi:hypothetical protein